MVTKKKKNQTDRTTDQISLLRYPPRAIFKLPGQINALSERYLAQLPCCGVAKAMNNASTSYLFGFQMFLSAYTITVNR